MEEEKALSNEKRERETWNNTIYNAKINTEINK